MANERIFISYKRVNKEPVFALIDRIERELGVKCWVDLDGIETSAQFASKICTAIDRAEVVLFMHSSAHLNIDYDNDWTIRELDYAHSENKHVVLVKLDDAPLKNIFKLIYGTSNNIDSRNPDQWNILMRDLRKWLNLEGSKAQPTPQQPKPQLRPQTTPTTPKTPLQELEEHLARLDKEVGDLFVFNGFGTYGYTDKTGKEVIPHQWKYARPFSEGLAAVMDFNLEWSFIDKTGKVVIPNTVAQNFSEGLAAVMDFNHEWGFMDKTGKVVIPYTWEDAKHFAEGLAAVQDSNHKWGFIDKTDKVVIPCTWNYAWHFSEGLAAVKDTNGKWGYIDKTGKVVIPCTWIWADYFREGLAVVQDSNDKYGFIDKTGKVTIPCTWYSAGRFSEGLVLVKDSNGKIGFIDKTGKVIIPFKWQEAKDFANGKAEVKGKVGLFGDKDAWHKIDKTGKVID